MKHWKAGAALFCFGITPAAFAADKEPCAANMVCASKPQSVVEAMQAAGFRAKLGKDDLGDPKIESAAAGYDFQLYFYGCENNDKCDALQLNLDFVGEDDNTAEYANKWNRTKRFAKMNVNDKKELFLRYDVSTIGGLNQVNFADILDWWATMLDEFNKFVKEQKQKT